MGIAGGANCVPLQKCNGTGIAGRANGVPSVHPDRRIDGNRKIKFENVALLGQVFDISKYARLTDQAEPQAIQPMDSRTRYR